MSTKDEGIKMKCLKEMEEIRKILTPQNQKLLDAAKDIWLELDSRLDTSPGDGNAVMAQTAIAILIHSLFIPSSDIEVALVTLKLIDILDIITKLRPLFMGRPSNEKLN